MNGFGGHAMCVIGYDDNLEGGAFQIMNSWGPEWGENGLGYVRYNDFMKFAKEAHGLYPMGSSEKPSSNKLNLKFGLINNSDGSNIQLKTKVEIYFQQFHQFQKVQNLKLKYLIVSNVIFIFLGKRLMDQVMYFSLYSKTFSILWNNWYKIISKRLFYAS